MIVFGAALIGFAGGWLALPAFDVKTGHGSNGGGADSESLLGEELPEHAKPSAATALKVSAVWLLLWLAPVVVLLAVFGADNFMWASDFPHSDSTFPESRAWIEKNFAGVPEDVRRKIVCENALSLYRMQLE